MRLLMITTGYLPYTFSENLCNGKLGYAMYQKGWKLDVISRKDEGPTYSAEWTAPWTTIKDGVYEVTYHTGNRLIQVVDTLHSSFSLGIYPDGGIRWARRAYELALKLCKENHYDAVLTRSPSDMPHLVGLRLKEKLGIRWIANWNDPATPIWPEPYTHHFSKSEQARKMAYTERCLRQADINTFPSQSLLDHFTSHFPFLTEKRTVVVPHIALAEEIAPKPLALPKGERFRMCHSGNLSVERDPELTFKALRELIDEGYDKLLFSIMGHINDYTNDLIKRYRLEQVVDCIGGFPYMQALEKMQAYDCLVLLEAKLKRGIFFASKFTDYAQLGKPILAISPIDGFAATTIGQYGGGVCVDNSDYLSIKKGILKLYNAWNEGTLHALYPTEKLYKQFSADSVIKIYDSMLSHL